ncbi:hypothetical protein NZ35_01895 [Pseudomonas chlororaphis]|uniref:Uncharacterized protein n=1 Tax=Pseudomonas chlororaphis TaxID=587753 RepID=A0A0A6DKK9_9PSED|nr:hypothetical protein NZ35_01895 [Pseudomonas chlororaphis]
MDKALKRELWRDEAVRAGKKNVVLEEKYIPCGSWLACDGAIRFNTSVTELTPSLASQLPQG